MNSLPGVEDSPAGWIGRAWSLKAKTLSSSSNVAAYASRGLGTSLDFSFRVCNMGGTDVSKAFSRSIHVGESSGGDK